MTSRPPETDPPDNQPRDEVPERYQGFSLRDVTWGYRDIFGRCIEELFEQGYLGPDRQNVTERFFGLLKRSDQSCFDHVLRQFLLALGPGNRWVMDLPGLFGDLVEIGGSLAEHKLYHGLRFFEALAEGQMGQTPSELRLCLDWIRRLREVDDELAMGFLAGYEMLRERLRPKEIEPYVRAALKIHNRHASSGCAFLRGELKSCETYIQSITQECRLEDVHKPLEALCSALGGADVEVSDLGGLDSDDLLERGTSMMLIQARLYLPARIRRFDSAADNRRWYMLCGIVAAGMELEDSFARIHGHPEYPTCGALAGRASWRANAFVVMEYLRVLRRVKRRWPGARRLVEWGLRADLAGTVDGSAEQLLLDAMDERKTAPSLRSLRREVDEAENCFGVADLLDRPWWADLRSDYPAMDEVLIGPVTFASDFLFPVSLSDPPPQQLVADLKDTVRRRRQGDPDLPPEAGKDDGPSDGDERPDRETEETAAPVSAYVYDEWDAGQNAYRSAWCHVHPRAVESASARRPDADWMQQARRIRTVFERFRPDLARREKHLADGDDINVDRLVNHMVDRKHEPSPPVRFYEKPRIQHRDLSALILLDVSGSTGEQPGGEVKVLDVEKQAVVVLGQGLAGLGDRFAVCGFSSNGREQCEYLMFKGFEDPWDGATGRIMAATPRNSTRMGPALRHSGYLLADQPTRQRLILLVTDGKPMDQGYDPNTRYAQYDVRMACEENVRRGIHTFAISTEENSEADMEVMFPGRRFVILPSLQRLPDVLPHLYLRLTM